METPQFDDMTPNQIREWGTEAAHRVSQFGEIRATLIVNCEPGRVLHKHGLTYDDTRPVLWNLVGILTQLTEAVDAAQAAANAAEVE